MRQVTSPTLGTQHSHSRKARARSVVAGVLVVGLAVVSAPSARAEGLYDERDQVRKSMAEAKTNIAGSKKQVAQANAVLAASEKELTTAKSELTAAKGELSQAQRSLSQAQTNLSGAKEKLAATEVALAAAKAKDAEAAQQLKLAQDELAASVARVAQGEADLAAQTKLIGSVVRTAYQQRTSLTSFAILLDTADASQVASRIQWTELIFDNTAAQLARLEQLQVELEAAKAARIDAEAKVAEQRRASQAQLATTQQLTDQAKGLANQAQQLTNQATKLADDAAGRAATVSTMVKKVAGLVERNRKLRDGALDELEADKAEYDKLQAEEKAITKKIQEQIAKDNADKNQRVNSMGFVRPLDANPGSPFGMRLHPILHYWRMHWGQDFGAKCGAPIWAMADGKVTQVLSTSQSHGLGNWTVINYGTYQGDHISSGYAHQSKIIVKVGQEVKQGQIVGYVGTTGLSTGCHLHLQIYKNGVRVNPRPYV